MPTSHLECQLCGAPCRPPRLHVCAGCSAMAYCSETHWRHHWKRGGHEEECARMAQQMGRAQELSRFPFPWAAELCTMPPLLPPPAATQPSQPHSLGHHHQQQHQQQQQGHDHQQQDAEDVTTSSPERPVRPICRVLLQAGGSAGGGCHGAGVWRRICPCAAQAAQASPVGETMPPGAWVLAPTAAVVAAGTAATATAEPSYTVRQSHSDTLPGPHAGGSGGEGLQRQGQGQGQGQDHGVERDTSSALPSPLPTWGQLQRPVLGRVGRWLPAARSAHVSGHVSRHVSGALDTRTGTAAGAGGSCGLRSKAGAAAWGAAGPLAAATEEAQGERCGLRPHQGAQQHEVEGQVRDGLEAEEGGEQGQQQERAQDVVWARDVWRLTANLVPPLRLPKRRFIGAGLQLASRQPPESTASNRQHSPKLRQQAGAVLEQGGDEREEATRCRGPGHQQREQELEHGGNLEPSHGGLYGVRDWLSYYSWSGLPLESPVALVLHFPLTLWHVLCSADRGAGGCLLGGSEGRGSRRGREGTGGRGGQAQGHEHELETVEDEQRQGQGAGRQGIARDAGQQAECKRRRLGAQGGEEEGGGGEDGQQVREQQHEYDRGKSQQHVRLQRSPDEQESVQRRGGRHLDVLYLGPQSELDCLDAFAVLLPLLPPATTLHLHMVGPDVPPSMHGVAVRYGSAVRRHGNAGGEWPGSAAGGRQEKQPQPPPPQQQQDMEEKEQAGLVNGVGGGCVGVSDGRGVLGRAGGGQCSDGAEVSGSGDGSPAAAGTSWGAGGAGLVVYLYSGVLHEQEEGVLLQLLQGVETSAGPVPGPELGHVRQEGRTACGPGVRAAAAAAGSQSADHGPQTTSAGTWARGPEACGLSYDMENGERPLVVLCPNAGLPAYPTWGPTLELLLPDGTVNTQAAKTQVQEQVRRMRHRPLAVMFTGYNEEECVRSGQMLYGMYGMELDVRQEVNPFRQPLWCYQRAGNALPSYSNGFLYGWYGM